MAMRPLFAEVTIMALCFSSGPGRAHLGQSGQMTHDEVLLGLHFLHQRSDCNTTGEGIVNVTPSFWDYAEHMPEDLAHVSYADFWHWWFEFERYKGDEKGLAEMDALVEACLRHGMKVKIDLAWSTWWTNDRDWEQDANLVVGPTDLDDWVHLCDLLGRRYRGRVALWLLQGEANDLKGYWQGAPIEHVHQVYRLGYQAFKRVDPGVMISIAGASPSQPRQALDAWVRAHAVACQGMYDDIPMNYFADVVGGDPYHSLIEYYRSIRQTLDELGEREVEVGSGESSFQWALDSYQVKSTPPPWRTEFDPAVQQPLSEEGQAWRCNESLGTFFDAGGNKFMFWGTEFAPGGGWPWRWGLRKYQDWWGIWPETHKIPGTTIVFRYDHPDGRHADLRPGWTSAPADPYHPIWQVYTFWAQAAPPASEAVRLPVEVHGSGPRILRLATYLRAQDRCVILLQNDEPTPIALEMDLRKTEWREGTDLVVWMRNETITYTNGARRVNQEKALAASVTRGKLALDLPTLVGFTTLEIARDRPGLDAECLEPILLERTEVGKPIEGWIILRNTGREAWSADEVRLALCEAAAGNRSWRLPLEVAPGEAVAVPVQLPAAESPGYTTHFLRLRKGQRGWFGPRFSVSTTIVDLDAPRKLVAFREMGHVRLKWFPPERASNVQAYELYRADGFQQPMRPLVRLNDTEYLDEPPERDHAYYYQVVALDRRGRRSRPSNEDNAKALSQPRIWDAEVTGHTMPTQMKLGEAQTVTVTLRNTGRKPWELGRAGFRFFLNATQLWGSRDEGHLPQLDLSSQGVIEPGQSVTLSFPYAAAVAGRFENHWVLCMDIAGKGRVYFGTPLLVETVVNR